MIIDTLKDLVPVIIGFKIPPGKPEIELIATHRGQIKYIYTLINAIAARIPPETIDAIRRNPNVEYIEIDEKVYKDNIKITNQINLTSVKITNQINLISVKSDIGEIYPIQTLQQIIPWGVERIGAITAHTYARGYAVKIAVIDTGIDYNHPDLASNYKGGYNFVAKNNNPMDDNSHGTHVSGIIAALDNDIGVVGVAPDAYLYAVKVLDSTGSGYTSDVIAGIQWSVNNDMRIANMSLGSKILSKSLKNACNNAYNSGLLLIAAAGNNGNIAGTGNNVDYPARFDSVIAVAATDINDKRGWFSSTGSTVELSAPGVNIYSTLPGGMYGTLSGTSMSCPHVTGVAAIIMSYSPTMTNFQTRIRMQMTVDDLGTVGRDNLYGYGLVNAIKSVSIV